MVKETLILQQESQKQKNSGKHLRVVNQHLASPTLFSPRLGLEGSE